MARYRAELALPNPTVNLETLKELEMWTAPWLQRNRRKQRPPLIDWTGHLRIVGPPHTRVTVGSIDPARGRLAVRVVIHDNHPHELDVDRDGRLASGVRLVENAP